MTGTTYRKLGLTYCRCPHNPQNPRHKLAHPDHPATIQVRADTITDVLTEFFSTRIFGPDRMRHLAATLPSVPAAADREQDQHTAALTKRLRDIDAAENAYTREIEQLAAMNTGTAAGTALRTRILARFAELETERTHIDTRLSELAAQEPASADPALLDTLPDLTGLLHQAPAPLQQELYGIFRIHITPNPDTGHVTCTATISAGTAKALATLTDQPADGAMSTCCMHL